MPMLCDGHIRDDQVADARRILVASSLTYIAASFASVIHVWPWLGGVRTALRHQAGVGRRVDELEFEARGLADLGHQVDFLVEDEQGWVLDKLRKHPNISVINLRSDGASGLMHRWYQLKVLLLSLALFGLAEIAGRGRRKPEPAAGAPAGRGVR